jgi:acetamidase/formamidase
VFRPGAGLYLGDPHGAQGDGEVNGTAIEQSCTFTIEVVVHPGVAPTWPVALTSDRIICTGIDGDLRRALEAAVQALVEFVVGWTGETLTAPDAYALCSLAADIGIAEAVNGEHVVYAALPTSVFAAGTDQNGSQPLSGNGT